MESNSKKAKLSSSDSSLPTTTIYQPITFVLIDLSNKERFNQHLFLWLIIDMLMGSSL